MEVFGSTRSHLARDHALITPDTHVTSPLVGWKNASAVIHISPHIGARFLQYTAHLEAGATSSTPGSGVQRFVYVRAGTVQITINKIDQQHDLAVGGYAFIPAGYGHAISSQGDATLIVFEKRAQPFLREAVPEPIVGDAANVPGEPFKGDPDARLQTLLPVTPQFDMAVNILTYQPGATLPQVEIHVMEHGLLMLDGMGVYRLSDQYYPVTAGDVIWMASYCPQWFVAMGKQPARYLYYKDVHRDGCVLVE